MSQRTKVFSLIGLFAIALSGATGCAIPTERQELPPPPPSERELPTTPVPSKSMTMPTATTTMEDLPPTPGEAEPQDNPANQPGVDSEAQEPAPENPPVGE